MYINIVIIIATAILLPLCATGLSAAQDYELNEKLYKYSLLNAYKHNLKHIGAKILFIELFIFCMFGMIYGFVMMFC